MAQTISKRLIDAQGSDPLIKFHIHNKHIHTEHKPYITQHDQDIFDL